MRYRRLFRAPPGFDSPMVPVMGAPGQVVRFSDIVRRSPVARKYAQEQYRGLSGPTARNGATLPLPDGSPGNPFWPYDEKDGAWGGQSGQMVTAPVEPSIPVQNVADPKLGPGADGLTLPFGQSFTLWHNPTSVQQVPLTANTPQNVPVMSTNLQRNLLIIQNGSTATPPDVPPILYIGFNAQPSIGFSLGILYNLGAILFDIITPRDSIYIVFGPFINGGGTVVTRGSVVQGTFTPN